MSRKPDQFTLAAGIRAFYNSGRGTSLVKVLDVNTRSGQALVREAETPAGERFNVPLHSLLPPLKVYGKRSRVWAAMHRPFKWAIIDTLTDYAEAA